MDWLIVPWVVFCCLFPWLLTFITEDDEYDEDETGCVNYRVKSPPAQDVFAAGTLTPSREHENK